MFSFNCPNCGVTLKVGAALADGLYTCPQCKDRFSAQQASAAPPPSKALLSGESPFRRPACEESTFSATHAAVRVTAGGLAIFWGRATGGKRSKCSTHFPR